MSSTPSAQPNLHQARIAAAHRQGNKLGALEALERGFALFRATFSSEAWRYYAGAAPFVACFIPIWVANGQIRVSTGVLLLEAILLTGTYLFRVWMISLYMHRVRNRAFGTPESKPNGVIARLAAVARLIRWKITFSIAMIAGLSTVIGGSWLYSACQFASIESREDISERHSLSGCVALANQWLGSGLLLYAMLFPLWIAVWLNGLIVTAVVPQLLHSILGLNTLLSTGMGMYALFRSSAFWLSTFAAAWLAFDPIVKCSFVVVYQHLRSRREGDDLRGLLASLPREKEKKAHLISPVTTSKSIGIASLIVFAAILTGASAAPQAHAAQAPPAASGAESPADTKQHPQVQKLRQALEEESQRAVYLWHDADHPRQLTWFDRLLDKTKDTLSRGWNSVRNFLRKFWPRNPNFSTGGKSRGNWNLKDLRLWLTVIAIVTLGGGIVLFYLRRRRQSAPISIPMAVAPLPDLTENTLASARSEDEWFALASQLQKAGELRLALRAAYLGLLAGLAQREWLTIRRDRTNREYLDEFLRKWRRRPQAAVDARAEIPEKLRGSLRQFDGVWYGLREVTPEAVATYQREQRELLTHV